jgi:hypothetical protein
VVSERWGDGTVTMADIRAQARIFGIDPELVHEGADGCIYVGGDKIAEPVRKTWTILDGRGANAEYFTGTREQAQQLAAACCNPHQATSTCAHMQRATS